MCRMVSWASTTPVTIRELLGDAAVERLLALATVHCHGWGAAWWDGSRFVVRRSPVGAAEDPDFLELLDALATRSAIVHLRMGTPGYGRGVVDNHPFTDGTWTMIHNGAVAPSAEVGKLLAPESTRSPLGSTDSERWFLALRDEIDRGLSVHQAVAAVVDRVGAVGLHASSWNSMMLGPDALHVISHHDPSMLPVDVKLWPDLYPEQFVCWPPYFDLRVRRQNGATVAISSGIVDDTTGWTLLPNKSVLRLPFDGAPGELTEVGNIRSAS
jgi:predicted glutamine amidotransferase